MTDFIFEDIKRSYYDTKTDIVHLRRNYKGEKELQKLLRHEVKHVIISKTSGRLKNFFNLLWETDLIHYAIVAVLLYIFYFSDLHRCYKLINDFNAIFNPFGYMNISHNLTDLANQTFNFTNLP